MLGLIVGITISIHAPRTGSDQFQNLTLLLRNEFQSTLPARGATVESLAMNIMNSISIHAPRTGSDGEQYATTSYVDISIHAPRTGSD